MRRFIIFVLTLFLLTGCAANIENVSRDTVQGESFELINTPFDAYQPSTKKMGERYYLFKEYESDLLFDEVKTHLENLNYTVVFVPPADETMSFPGEEFYGVTAPSKKEAMYVLTCNSIELAKDVFKATTEYKLSKHEHQMSLEPFFYANSVLRIGKTVYWVREGETILRELLSFYGIPMPEATPLYNGGSFLYPEAISYDQTLSKALAEGYVSYDGYDEMFHGEFLKDMRRLISPDNRGYLCLVRLADMNSDVNTSMPTDNALVTLVKQTQMQNCLEFLLPIDNLAKETIKLVALSSDTFVVGTAYHIDVFLEKIGS